MRAWQIAAETGPSGLRLVETAIGEPGPREILVAVEACALNRADLLQTLGRYPLTASGPVVPGLEFAGRVLARGAAAARFAVGDRVMGLADGGAFAERLVVDERLALRRPEALATIEAGAFPEAFLTAFDAVVGQGGLAAGMTLVVHAAGSGVGCAALAIARELGARVVAGSSPGKWPRLRELGAAAVYDTRSPELGGALRAAVGAGGADVVLDLLGAPTLAHDLAAAATGARIVVIGLLGGARCEIDLGLLMRKRASVAGSLLRPRSAAEKGELIAAFEHRLGAALREGRLKPIIHAVLPFEDLPQGLEAMRRDENLGKIAISHRGAAP